MKGRNYMTLNQDTMQEVVQYWVNSRLANSSRIQVTNVKASSNPSGSFKITLESVEPKKGEE